MKEGSGFDYRELVGPDERVKTTTRSPGEGTGDAPLTEGVDNNAGYLRIAVILPAAS